MMRRATTIEVTVKKACVMTMNPLLLSRNGLLHADDVKFMVTAFVLILSQLQRGGRADAKSTHVVAPLECKIALSRPWLAG